MRHQRFLKLVTVAIGFMVSGAAAAFDHGLWDQVVKKYVNAEHFVAYKQLRADAKDPKHPFPKYLAALKAVSKKAFDSWSVVERKAFLINAYNAFTFQRVFDHYEKDGKRLASLTDIRNILQLKIAWSEEWFSLLDGAAKSLDGLEHGLLRGDSEPYKDYRIHAAVNCASYSCPVLRREAYTGAAVDTQLDEQMRVWLADRKRNDYKVKEGKLLLSKIFDWYGKDFERWGGGIPAVIRKYGPASAVKALETGGKIEFLDYGWRLNDSTPPAG